MPSEHQREMKYLRQFMAHDDPSERREMEAKIVQAQRDERCVRRAVRPMALLGGAVTSQS